jgi:hypothetical protein
MTFWHQLPRQVCRIHFLGKGIHSTDSLVILGVVTFCVWYTIVYVSSFCRYCTKPKELVVECSLPTPGSLDELLENHITCALAFLTDHRYDPSEVYEDEFQEELKGIPDPKIDPQKILNDFLDVLHTLGTFSLLLYFLKGILSL